jgi:molybdopterin molybdotransferase
LLLPPLSLEEAQTQILSAVHPLESETLPLELVAGRILARAIYANTALPSFAHSAMDGYAIRAEDTHTGEEVELRVIGSIAAGQIPQGMLEPGTAIRIMTGAPLPAGCTAVVKMEETTSTSTCVRIRKRLLPGENIIPMGKDIRQGEKLLEAGEMITPSALGLLASLGQSPIPVVKRPRVAVLALGDELIPVHETLAPGKIRVSNLYTIGAQIQRYGGIPLNLGIARDDLHEIRQKLEAEQAADFFVTLGGSQRGDYDLVDDLLVAEKGRILFREVALNYSRSFIFGRLWDKLLFGLPGSPLASRVSFEVFVRPALRKMAGHRTIQCELIPARLTDKVAAQSARRVVVPVKLCYQEGQWRAIPLQRERALSHPPLLQANGLLYLSPHQEILAGEEVFVEPWEKAE